MTSFSTHLWEKLPGWEIVSDGLRDISAGRVTPAACALWIALPKLRRAGIVDDARLGQPIVNPELVMYRLLRSEGGNAYSRYNALLRRLVSFEHAVERLKPGA